MGKADPTLFLFTEKDNLSLEILKRASQLGIETFVISQEGDWNSFLSKEKILKNPVEKPPSIHADYIICNLTNFFDEEGLNKALKIFEEASLLNQKTSSKTIFLLPFLYQQNFEPLIKRIVDLSINDKEVSKGVIFLGDILGDNSFLNMTLTKIAREGKLDFLPTSFPFYPISAEKAAFFVVKSLLSLKTYGTTTAVLGKKIYARDIVRYLRKVDAKIFLKYQKRLTHPKSFQIEDKFFLEENQKEKIIQSFEEICKKEKSFKKSWRKDFKKNLTKSFAIPLKFLCLFLFFPLFQLLLGFFLFNLFLLFSYKSVNPSPQILKLVNYSSLSLDSYLSKISTIPFLSKPYHPVFFLNSYLEKSSGLLLRVSEFEGGLKNIYDQLFREDENFLDRNSNIGSDLAKILVDIERQRQFLIAETKEFQEEKLLFPSPILNEFARLKVNPNLIILFERLYEILGKDIQKKYLVVFVNGEKLMPVGGEIIAASLVSVSNGRVKGIENFLSEDIDKKLKGVLYSPRDLGEFFAEETWLFKHSNWDPDFNFSARDISWFIDRTLDVETDGVILVSYDFLLDLNRLLGQNRVSTKTGLEEIEGFWKNLRMAGRILSERSLFSFLSKALQEKQILFFFNNEEIQKLVNSLKVGGFGEFEDCLSLCKNELIFLSETTQGASAKNVLRKAKIKVSFQEGLVKKRLDLFLENKDSRDYLSLIRLVVDKDASFAMVEKKISDQIVKRAAPRMFGYRNLKEAETSLILPAKLSGVVSFFWEGKIEDFENLRYNLALLKQAGVPAYPVELYLDLPNSFTIELDTKKNQVADRSFSYSFLFFSDLEIKLSSNQNDR